MKSKLPTITEIAKRLTISVSTVSRAFIIYWAAGTIGMLFKNLVGSIKISTLNLAIINYRRL